MAKAPDQPPETHRRLRGFEAASGLMRDKIRKAAESRGFAVTRLLTHWAEVAGADMAEITRPIKVTYSHVKPKSGQKGADEAERFEGKTGSLKMEPLGATLVLLVASAHAPIVQMQIPVLKERINAAYGFSAISRISLTQTASSGFAEGQAEFTPRPKAPPAPDPAVLAKVAETTSPIADAGLRAALEALGNNIVTRRKTETGRT